MTSDEQPAATQRAQPLVKRTNEGERAGAEALQRLKERTGCRPVGDLYRRSAKLMLKRLDPEVCDFADADAEDLDAATAVEAAAFFELRAHDIQELDPRLPRVPVFPMNTPAETKLRHLRGWWREALAFRPSSQSKHAAPDAVSTAELVLITALDTTDDCILLELFKKGRRTQDQLFSSLKGANVVGNVKTISERLKVLRGHGFTKQNGRKGETLARLGHLAVEFNQRDRFERFCAAD